MNYYSAAIFYLMYSIYKDARNENRDVSHRIFNNYTSRLIGSFDKVEI